jgi:calcineurin-like phosphoesterase family protein
VDRLAQMHEDRPREVGLAGDIGVDTLVFGHCSESLDRGDHRRRGGGAQASDSFQRGIDSPCRRGWNRESRKALRLILFGINMMRAAKLESSLISRVAYDEEGEALSIWFRETGRYVYYGVPRADLRSAAPRPVRRPLLQRMHQAPIPLRLRSGQEALPPFRLKAQERPRRVRAHVTIFFTSDTHFGDHRTLNIHKRPFSSGCRNGRGVDRGWNALVGEGDEVWHLGDFARKLADVLSCFAASTAESTSSAATTIAPRIGDVPGWTSVRDYHEMEVDGQALVLCHYPFRSWNGQHRRAINLHGHSHGKLKPMLRQYDVGVDARAFRPVTMAELLAR